MNAKGWRPFWAALLAGLLVLVPLVGGTILLTRCTLRTKLASALRAVWPSDSPRRKTA